jgi:anti-sigma B factor antagonist
MNINITSDGTKATLAVEGKLTVQTAPDLEAAVMALDTSLRDIDIDLSAVDYVSSAGLRVFVTSSKLAEHRGGTLRLLHPIDVVVEVLEMTGLYDVLVVVR